MRITGSTSRTRAIARAARWRPWQGNGGRDGRSNRLRHPAEDTVDQAGAPPVLRRHHILGDAALVKIIQEYDVVRLGDGETLLADEHRVVVEKRPDERYRGRCGAVLRDHETRGLEPVRFVISKDRAT